MTGRVRSAELQKAVARNSSGATGVSARRSPSATASGPIGPQSRSTRSSGTTRRPPPTARRSRPRSASPAPATSARPGPARRRRPATPARRRGGPTAAAARDPAIGDEPVGADGGRLQQHEVGGGRRRAEPRRAAPPRRRRRRGAGAGRARSPRRGCRPPARSSRPGAPAPRRPARASPARTRWRPSGRAWASSSPVRVLADLVGAAPRLGHRVAGGQHPGAQPPQRARRHVAVDDAPAGGDQPGRIEAQRGRARRPSPAPAGPARHPRPGPRTGAARSGAFRATLSRGRYRSPLPWRPDTAGRPHAHAARRRWPHAQRVADHVPPRPGGGRSVHERERVDPRHRRPGAPHAPGRRRARLLAGRRRRRGRRGLPRPAGRRVPHLRRPRPGGHQGPRPRAAAGVRRS